MKLFDGVVTGSPVFMDTARACTSPRGPGGGGVGLETRKQIVLELSVGEDESRQTASRSGQQRETSPQQFRPEIAS